LTHKAKYNFTWGYIYDRQVCTRIKWNETLHIRTPKYTNMRLYILPHRVKIMLQLVTWTYIKVILCGSTDILLYERLHKSLYTEYTIQSYKRLHCRLYTRVYLYVRLKLAVIAADNIIIEHLCCHQEWVIVSFCNQQIVDKSSHEVCPCFRTFYPFNSSIVYGLGEFIRYTQIPSDSTSGHRSLNCD